MIKIEVTGNSIGEVADKLLAIGASLRGSKGGLLNSAPHPVGNVHVSEDADINPAALTVVEVEVAEAAPVDPIPALKTVSVAEAAESLRTTAATSSTPAPAASVSEDEELEVVDLPIATLDIEADVRPLILKVVTARGKPVMEELLSRFGVAKASQIEPALLPELVALMQEALGK